ncbi:hypothetical protein VE03_09160 [Pseudogymnoascus sp. 23342-1-I1]|nr:hypothetical protein VE03_09160 [Pseudogymnoascus sp. 23342-1-I1]
MLQSGVLTLEQQGYRDLTNLAYQHTIIQWVVNTTPTFVNNYSSTHINSQTISSSVMNTSSVPCALGVDDTFGPTVKGCRDDFDFTLLFEQGIMTLAPAAFLLLLMLPRIYQLNMLNLKTKRNWLYWSKCIVLLLSAGLQLAILVLWIVSSGQRNKISIASSSLTFGSALLLCVLSHFEHTRTVRPSTIIETYLFFSIVFDAVQLRTLWNQSVTTLAAILSASLVVKIAVLFLEAKSKKDILTKSYSNLSPETTSGIFGRSTFYWIKPLLMAGFTSAISIDESPPLDKELLSESLHNRLQRTWDRSNHSKFHALAIATFRCFWASLLTAVVPRLCLIGFNYSQPFLINRVIDFVGETGNKSSANNGYGLIGATALIYIGIAISTAIYKHKTYRVITMIRGALVSIVYSKTLIIQDGAFDNAAALTLMSTDVDRIASSLQTVHEIWANVIELSIAIYLLQRQVGVASVVTVGLVIMGTLISTQLSKRMGPNQALWNKAVQHRVTVTSTALGSIKGIKLMGLTEHMAHQIQDLRVAELELSKAFRRLIAWMNLNSNFTSLVSPFVTFAVVYGTRGSLNVAQAFTSLSIITLLTGPLSSLLSSLPNFAAGLGCFDRIQKYLLSPQRLNHREIPKITVSSVDMGLIDRKTKKPSPHSLEMFPTSSIGDAQMSREKCILSARSCTFGEPPVLHDINLDVERSSLTVILGPNGSGKSMLLKGLIGELEIRKGSLLINTSSVAYCAQDSWLINASIQQNITGSFARVPEDPVWYQTVINSCALDIDLASTVEKDQKIVGSGGINMSGGQKQRIALARALYSRKELLVLDDIFSGLDLRTSNLIFERVFSRNGLVRQLGTTVILATHAVRLLPLVDHIVVLSPSGTIEKQGRLEVLGLTNAGVHDIADAHDTDHQNNLADEPTNKAPEMKSIPHNAADINRRTGDLTIYKYYWNSIGLKKGSIYLALYVGYVFFYKFPQVWLQFWTEANERSPGVNSKLYLGIYGLLTGLSLIFVWTTIWFWFVVTVPVSAQNLHLKLLTTVVNAPFAFFTETDNGVTLNRYGYGTPPDRRSLVTENRFSQDMQLVDQALPSAAFATTFSVMCCIAEAALISSGAGLVAVTIPPTVVILYVLQKFYLRTSRQLRFLDLEAKAPLYTQFTETLNGLHTIRAFGWEGAYQKRNSDLLNTSQKPYYHMYCIQRWLNLILDFLVAGVAVILVAIATQGRWVTGSGAIGVALNNVLGFNMSLSGLINSWTTLETSLGAISRLKNFEQETENENQPDGIGEPPEDWSSKGTIVFENVTSSLHAGSDIILRDISISIKEGEKIGICGRTGSGKSSLILAILRLLSIRSGSITIDGFDISTIPRAVVRSRIATIPQDPVFLPGSIRSNLDPHCNSNDEAITAALFRVGLWTVVETHGGLNTDIAQLPLSHGQKQMLCLARAMLAKSTILILDEATSSMDVEMESLMKEILTEEFEDCT